MSRVGKFKRDFIDVNQPIIKRLYAVNEPIIEQIRLIIPEHGFFTYYPSLQFQLLLNKIKAKGIQSYEQRYDLRLTDTTRFLSYLDSSEQES